jgi:hypothetical protein
VILLDITFAEVIPPHPGTDEFPLWWVELVPTELEPSLFGDRPHLPGAHWPVAEWLP